jgi:hypothetical protein
VRLALAALVILGGCGKHAEHPPPHAPTGSGSAAADPPSAALAPVPANVAAKVGLEEVVHGLDRPVALVAAPGDPRRRLFIVEQHTGRIRVLENGKLADKPFLVVGGLSTDALRAAFDVSWPDAIERLTTGMSASLVYRITVRERAYVLRIHVPSPQRPTSLRYLTCMRLAAEAGIAPRVHYASEADAIVITDHVDARPFPPDMIAHLAPLLRRLHALPPFHASVDQFDVIARFLAQFEAAPALALGELPEWFAQIAASYPRQLDHVSSHHDLKPENMLFDGARLWFVDWDAAFLDDRNFDLVIPGNFFVRGDADLERYRTLYYGAPPSVGQRARYELIRVIEHIFYAVLLGLLAARGGAADDGTPAEDFRAFHEHLLAGTIVREPAQQLRYAKVHAAAGLRAVRSRAFPEWLARCRDG